MRRDIAAILCIVAGSMPAMASAEWHRGYVIEWTEPAIYYGAKEGVIDPGTDCPAGPNKEIDWIKVLLDAGYTREEAELLRNTANPTRSPVHGQNQMAFRGKDRANVYTNPTSTPDPGLVGVSGSIAEGVDLDGNRKNGFTSPTGEKGIDNNFYKTVGCWKTYRGPHRLSSGALQFNDAMRNGGWTTVIVVAGQGDDPLNDDDVTVGFYASADKMVKDGNGAIARDYTFSIKPHSKYELLFEGKVENGVITSKKASAGMLREPAYWRDLELLKAQIRLEMKPDGALVGYVGGYRPWKDVYDGWVDARGPVIESLTWVQLPGVYYALSRNADFSPSGPKGDKTHISYALRVDALPAFIMTPDAGQQAAVVKSYKAIAQPEAAPAPSPAQMAAAAKRPHLVDGIIVDPNSPYQAGPTADVFASRQALAQNKSK